MGAEHGAPNELEVGVAPGCISIMQESFAARLVLLTQVVSLIEVPLGHTG